MRIFACLIIAMPLLAQDPPPKPPPPHAPKNLQLLKPEDIRATMAAFRTALGVQCTGCHVQGDFASDDKPEKTTARKMIVMTREINANNFSDGKMHVTCFTCHRGEEHPKTAAEPAAPAPAK